MISKKGHKKMVASASQDVRQIEHRLVPDPMMTDAEYFERRRARPGPNVGKLSVPINMVELIGGLARIKDRTEQHEAVAARFRLLHDRAQLGGARATDYAAVRVDSSINTSVVGEIGERARRDYAEAVQFLGMIRSSLVERVVIYDMSLRRIAGGSGRASLRAGQELREALDDLAVHFQMASKRHP